MIIYVLTIVFGINSATDLTMAGKYEESEKALVFDKSNSTKYHYLRMLNLHSLNNKECKKHAEEILDRTYWGNVPKRYRDLAFIIAFDVKQWKKNDLSDISRDMKNVSNRLDKAKAGKKTQKIQDGIIKKLDNIIAKIEKAQKDAQQAANAQQEEWRKRWDNKSQKPLDDSQIANNTGPGRVNKKKLFELAQNWGKLPPKERARATIQLTRDMPPKYREIIKEYFRRASMQEELSRRKKHLDSK